jgi:hypothetical protein
MFEVKKLSNDNISIWSIKDILNEINKDRDIDWQDYDETDWLEGWFIFCEGRDYTLVSTTIPIANTNPLL